MRAELYTIELGEFGRLSIMARPRGGDWLGDEIAALRVAQVEVLVSLLTPGEVSELELREEERYCRELGIVFFCLPIEDRGVPALYRRATELLKTLHRYSTAGRHVAIHCRQGIGRSSLLAASLLTMLGYTADQAFDLIAQARGRSVPDTEEQRAWVRELAGGARGEFLA